METIKESLDALQSHQDFFRYKFNKILYEMVLTTTKKALEEKYQEGLKLVQTEYPEKERVEKGKMLEINKKKLQKSRK